MLPIEGINREDNTIITLSLLYMVSLKVFTQWTVSNISISIRFLGHIVIYPAKYH